MHRIIFKNIKFYQWHATAFWSNGFFYPFNEWLFIIISVFSACGFLIRFKKFGIYEFFFLFYLMIIFTWPTNQGTRFLIPIIPLYLFYFFYFFEILNSIKFNRKYLNSAISFLLFIVIVAAGLSYCMLYLKRGLPAINQGIHRFESIKLFDVVRNKTNENDVIIFTKPRVLSLMTARKSSSYHKAKRDEDLLDYFDKIGASYIILPVNNYSYLKDPYLMRFMLRNKNRFIPIYSNDEFAYYRII